VRPEAYHEINNFYTATVYEKGAEVIRALRAVLGPGSFRKGMDLYFGRHDGTAATVDEFIACFAEASEVELEQFTRWYAQAGTPELAVTGSFDPRAKTYRLEVVQTMPPTPGQPDKEPMVIPLSLGLIGSDGRDLALVTADGRTLEHGVLTISRAVETVEFVGIGQRPVPSLNRGFAAPIKLSANISAEDLRFLAAHDRDPFNRWQAVQSLATALLVENVAALRAGRALRHDDGLMAAFAAILADPELEPAFIAQAITVPGEADIARDIGRDVDTDAVFAARAALRAVMGRQLAAALDKHYRGLADSVAYSPDAASAGRRALKNTCLDLLAAAEDPSAIVLAYRQYQTADNMTDRMAALATLSLHDVPERAAALDDFYDRFRANPLVIDKWFALQATIPEPATLDRVRALTAHPGFSLSTPNRVRALIGSFATANQTQFNRVDGAGYDFVVDTVLTLDPKNPQVAARLLAAFKSWRVLEAMRRARAEAALRRVAAVAALSPDVGDIVRRALGEA